MSTRPDPQDLATLDALTDAEADNVRTAIRQGDLEPDAWPITWATVVDSVRQMPDDVLAHYGDPGDLTGALERVVAAVGESAEVLETYQIDAPDLLP